MNNLTLQDVMQKYADSYRALHKLPYETHKVINAIERCRTSKLGSHFIKCNHSSCQYERKVNNSCRNKHCPACQSYQSARWVLERKDELLPVGYFHVIFTIPHELNVFLAFNACTIYKILFESSYESLRIMCEDKKHLGATAGCISVLHTWGQNMMSHPHVHMIVPGGGLNNDKKWIGCSSKRFLVPVGPLKILFKNKFLFKLRKLYKKGSLDLSGDAQMLCESKTFNVFSDKLYQKSWNIKIKEPFGGAEQVLKYLGRYTHRVAISNSRIESFEDNKVTFSLKDYKKGGQKRKMTLSSTEFLRRFLLHILPKGFRRIRMYGFLSNRNKRLSLKAIGIQLNQKHLGVKKKKRTCSKVMLEFFGVNIRLCPKCKKGSLSLLMHNTVYNPRHMDSG